MAGHAQAVAKLYPTSNRAAYQNAADNLRIPFWDWAAIPQEFPAVSKSLLILSNQGFQNTLGSLQITDPF